MIPFTLLGVRRVLDVGAILDVRVSETDGIVDIYNAADADNDQAALVMFYESNPDGDWLKVGYEVRQDWRRMAYGRR